MITNDNNGPRCNLNPYGEMLSETRVRELLDYATNYGECDHRNTTGEQRGQIIAYMRVLGILRTPV